MKIPAGEFKTHCLQLMDKVKLQREEIVITKHGKPVAKLVPPDGPPREIFGCCRDRIEIIGDIVGPVVDPSDWDCLR